jgi:glycosyltransferase involved in cell wall biosynthesis
VRLTLVAPPAVPIPVGGGYGGIEAAAEWLAVELVRRGHEVTLMGNVADGPSAAGWTGRRIATETDPLSPGKYELLRGADAVHDFTHSKASRMARTKRYLSTTMWTDVRSGRDVYPSAAVREAFKDPGAPVIPLGVPVDGATPPEGTAGRYVCLGRIAPYKGQDLAIRVARAMGQRLLVAGHTGRFGDPYFAMTVRRTCEVEGMEFVPDPPDLHGYLDGAAGLVHLHRWVESFSIVAAQSLLRGVPVLTTDVGAPQEWVRATDGGMVVSLGDLEAGRWEASGVADFFETNWSSRRPGISKRARDLFDVRRVAERYEGLYGGPA